MKYLLILILFASCSTQRNAEKFAAKNPKWEAERCAAKFPVKESTDTLYQFDTTLQESYEREFAYLNYLLDSLVTKGSDTVTVDRIRELIKLREVPKTVTIVKTVESTAKLEVLRLQHKKEIEGCELRANEKQSELIELKKKYTEQGEKLSRTKKTRNTYFWLLVALTVFTFRKPLLRLFGV